MGEAVSLSLSLCGQVTGSLSLTVITSRPNISSSAPPIHAGITGERVAGNTGAYVALPQEVGLSDGQVQADQRGLPIPNPDRPL